MKKYSHFQWLLSYGTTFLTNDANIICTDRENL